MGYYLEHDMDPATVPLRRDLTPYISQSTLETMVASAGGYPEQQAIVDGAINDAEAFAEGFARLKYVVPVVPIPSTDPFPADWLRAVGRIAAHNMWSRGAGMPEQERQAYEDAVAWLKGLAAFKVRMNAELSEIAENGGLLVSSRFPRQISQDTMRF